MSASDESSAAGELGRVRLSLMGAGISDHEGGAGETYYVRPTWHMAEEAAAYSKEYLDIHALLDGACSVVARYQAGWVNGEVVDGEGVWSRPHAYGEDTDEEWMTGEEAAFLAHIEALSATTPEVHP